jgi:Ni/Fe-hydrogenase 1 B-type cytochrome subunit
MSESWLPKMFSWIVPILGGDLLTRQIHHIFMWVFIIFTIIHVYLVFYHDYIERRGITSSMIGGWKFIEKEHLDELERLEEEEHEKVKSKS